MRTYDIIDSGPKNRFMANGRIVSNSGRLWQPHNLPRPNLKQEVIEFGIETLKANCADLFFDNVMEVASNAIRGCIVAPPGKKLVISDLASIEGRVLPWLAGEQWALDAYGDYDFGTGPDMYNLAYARAFRVDPKQVTKGQRQTGKVMELACFARDTQVLTNNGIKAIVDVLESDLLWDGITWVKHKGTVARGVKQTVNVNGTFITPDHLISIKSSWRPVRELVLNEKLLSQAYETGSENLPSSVISTKAREVSPIYTHNVLAERLRIWFPFIIYVVEKVRGVTPALKSKLAIGVRNIMGMQPLCRMKSTEFAFWGAYPRASIVAIIPQTGDILITGDVGSRFLKPGEKIEKSFFGTLCLFWGGIIRTWNWIEKTWMVGTNRVIYVLLPRQKISATDGNYASSNKDFSMQRDVYDIVNAGPRNRFTIRTKTGYLLVHNCGFGGSVGAFLTMAMAYKLDLVKMSEGLLPELLPTIREKAENSWDWAVENKRTYDLDKKVYLVCRGLTEMWRLAHPKIVTFWSGLETMAKVAIENKGKEYQVGKIKFIREGSWLRAILPSGRSLCYAAPRIVEDKDGEHLSYAGNNQYSRKWGRLRTYGGRWAENVTQAVARDIMTANMPRVEAVGYEIVSTIHDEIITEVPDNDNFTATKLSALLATNPVWAKGLPLAAAGFETYRYRKND